MRLSLFVLTAVATNLVAAAIMARETHSKKDKKGKGPEIWGSYNDIDECEMHQAIHCLAEQICTRRKIPYQGKIRCTIGSSVAYVCNHKTHNKPNVVEKYRGEEGGGLACDGDGLYDAWRQIRIAKASATGWWFDRKKGRTYGFDRSCRNGECDNGWKKGSEGEQCTNIGKGKGKKNKQLDWTFDFVAQTYPNYTTKYLRPIPELHDPNEPVYFNPWQDGKRPT